MNDFATTLKAITKMQGPEHDALIMDDLAMIPGKETPFFPRGIGLRAHVENLIQTSGTVASGWLLWSEELQILSDGASVNPASGWLLAGEIHVPADPIAKSPDQTHVIRQKDRGWEIRTLIRADVRSPSNTGLPPAFLETRELLPWPQLKTLSGRKLCYEVAWRLNASLPTPCYRPAESRFVGFIR